MPNLETMIAEFKRLYAAMPSQGPLQEGVAGTSNVVTFDGHDVRGAGFVHFDSRRAFFIHAHNHILPLLEAVEDRLTKLQADNEKLADSGSNLAHLVQRMLLVYGGVDNGYCKTCRADRHFDDYGHRERCTNEACLEYQAEALIDAGDRIVNPEDYENSDEPKSQLAAMSDFHDALNRLRSDEGNTVQFICDNPDFGDGPGAAIYVNADWTNWRDERFTGANIFECVAKADAARAARTIR